MTGDSIMTLRMHAAEYGAASLKLCQYEYDYEHPYNVSEAELAFETVDAMVQDDRKWNAICAISAIMGCAQPNPRVASVVADWAVTPMEEEGSPEDFAFLMEMLSAAGLYL